MLDITITPNKKLEPTDFRYKCQKVDDSSDVYSAPFTIQVNYCETGAKPFGEDLVLEVGSEPYSF